MHTTIAHEHTSNETMELAALYVIGCLWEPERLDFEKHLQGGCRICREEIEQASSIMAAMARTAVRDGQPNRMRNRFIQILKSESGGEPLNRRTGCLDSAEELICMTDEIDIELAPTWNHSEHSEFPSRVFPIGL